MSSTPKNWPADVVYLTAPAYSPALSLGKSLLAVDTSSAGAETVVKPLKPCGLVKIQPITASSHPAYGQHGLFAAQHLPAGSFILPYLGFVHSREEANPSSDYDLSLNRFTGVGVDATKMGNEARFVNDYRGTGAMGPNAEFKDIAIEVKLPSGKVSLEIGTGVFVLPAGKANKRAKGIAKGQEIVVSYGKGFWNERQTGAGTDEIGGADAGSQ
jgi:hypothetical protein